MLRGLSKIVRQEDAGHETDEDLRTIFRIALLTSTRDHAHQKSSWALPPLAPWHEPRCFCTLSSFFIFCCSLLRRSHASSKEEGPKVFLRCAARSGCLFMTLNMVRASTCLWNGFYLLVILLLLLFLVLFCITGWSFRFYGFTDGIPTSIRSDLYVMQLLTIGMSLVPKCHIDSMSYFLYLTIIGYHHIGHHDVFLIDRNDTHVLVEFPSRLTEIHRP